MNFLAFYGNSGAYTSSNQQVCSRSREDCGYGNKELVYAIRDENHFFVLTASSILIKAPADLRGHCSLSAWLSCADIFPIYLLIFLLSKSCAESTQWAAMTDSDGIPPLPNGSFSPPRTTSQRRREFLEFDEDNREGIRFQLWLDRTKTWDPEIVANWQALEVLGIGSFGIAGLFKWIGGQRAAGVPERIVVKQSNGSEVCI